MRHRQREGRRLPFPPAPRILRDLLPSPESQQPADCGFETLFRRVQSVSRHPSRSSGMSARTLVFLSFVSARSLTNAFSISMSTHQLVSESWEQHNRTLSPNRIPGPRLREEYHRVPPDRRLRRSESGGGQDLTRGCGQSAVRIGQLVSAPLAACAMGGWLYQRVRGLPGRGDTRLQPAPNVAFRA